MEVVPADLLALVVMLFDGSLVVEHSGHHVPVHCGCRETFVWVGHEANTAGQCRHFGHCVPVNDLDHVLWML